MLQAAICNPWSLNLHEMRRRSEAEASSCLRSSKPSSAPCQASFYLKAWLGLATQHAVEFAAVVRTLRFICNGHYNVAHKVWHSTDHGIPHNRKRLWIIGIAKEWDEGSFLWPPTVKPVSMAQVLDPIVRKAGHAPLILIMSWWQLL